MREILFRGKRLDDGEWVHGFLTVDDSETPNQFVIDYLMPHKSCYGQTEIDPETVGQFTGLTDKNVKKIFEGDIVEYNDGFDYFEGVIVFENGAYGIGTKEIIGISSGCCDNFANLWQLFWDQPVVDEAELYYCKVIGNIHDNPELLKGE